MVSEVKNLQNLTGIMLTDLERMTSTISLPNYPRALSPGWSKRSKGMNQEMTVNEKLMMNLTVENKDGQTKGRRFTSHKCLGSAWWNRAIRFRLDKHVIRAHVLEIGRIGARIIIA